MDFRLSDEERLLDDMIRDFVEREYTFEHRRAIMRTPSGLSRDVWRQLAELGLLGIAAPEAHGGVDAGPVATMLVMNAVGQGLLLEPFAASAVVATALLREIDDVAHRDALLPAMVQGERIVALAHVEPTSRHDPVLVETRADSSADGYRITGRKSAVADAADTLIVSARGADGVSLFCVPRDTPGLGFERYTALDGRRLADVELTDVTVSADARIGPDGRTGDALAAAHDAGVAAVCAEAIGAMQALLDTTAEYLRTRQQFGRPIGRFQALQHRAADMLIHVEQARSMSYLATLKSVDSDLTRRRRALSAAKTLIGRACRFVGQQAVQLHGGMGVTDELAVSHYFKRLAAIELEFGDAEFHLDRYVALGGS